jgi:ABC-type transport system involved in cytochrome c biogenesis permease subunit
MVTAAIILFIVSAILFMATLYYGLAFLRPGVYPPKQLLKNRALAAGSAGVILLVIGILIMIIW